MLRKAENVFSVILSDAKVVTTDLPAVGVQVTSQNTPKGAVVLVDAGMYRIASVAGLADGEGYFIVQSKGPGKPFMRSPLIVKGTEKLTSSKYVAPKQQITSILVPAVADNTSYYVKVRKNDNDATNRSQPTSLFGQYKTKAGATEKEVAYGIMKNLNRNAMLEPANNYLKAEVTSEAALGATALSGLTNPTGALTFIKNSPVVTATDTQDLSVGDFIKVQRDITETLDAPVYEIKAISGTTITLTTPFVDSDEVIADTDLFLVTAALGNAADFKVKLTGKQANFDVASFRDYYVNRFTASFSDENAVIEHVQGATEGNGAWQAVAMDEYMNYGYEGQNDMIGIPPKPRDQEVIEGGKYSVVNIKWREDITHLVSKSGAEGNVLVYLNLDDSGATGTLPTTPANTGETLATALGITPSDLNE